EEERHCRSDDDPDPETGQKGAGSSGPCRRALFEVRTDRAIETGSSTLRRPASRGDAALGFPGGRGHVDHGLSVQDRGKIFATQGPKTSEFSFRRPGFRSRRVKRSILESKLLAPCLAPTCIPPTTVQNLRRTIG